MTHIVTPIVAAKPGQLAALAKEAREGGADMVEVRLDECLDQGGDAEVLLNYISELALPVLLTCRHADEGGCWAGDPGQRRSWLQTAERAGAALIDVEAARFAELDWRPTKAQLVLSYHDFNGMPDDLEARVDAMYAAGADVAKIAVTPSDAADLAIFESLLGETEQPLIAIGMGEVGLPTRLLAGAWGAFATFGALDASRTTAAGQPTLVDLVQRYRIKHQGPETHIFGVLGNPVGHSMSPAIHNAAFAHHELDAVYVPFLAHDAKAFWHACCDWVDGLSITIPHKEALIDELDDLEPLAHSIGAINTVYRDDAGKAIGANTDADAALDCVRGAIGGAANRCVLLLGAGGVARAIAYAFHQAGSEVFIANRTHSRAEALAGEIGCRAITMDEAAELSYDVLINGTSVGMKSERSPWPVEAHRPNSLVFDTVYTPMETQLLLDAQHGGATPVCGVSMFVRQAVGQYQRWTNQPAPVPLMRRAMLEALGYEDIAETCAESGSGSGSTTRLWQAD